MRTKIDQTANLDSIVRPVVSALIDLIERLKDGRDINGELKELRLLLETIPFTTDEFGLACNRLRNAQQYLHVREPGAAVWELDALMQRLRTYANAKPIRRK